MQYVTFFQIRNLYLKRAENFARLFLSFCSNYLEIFTIKWREYVWKVSRLPPIASEAAIYLILFHVYFFIEFVRIRIEFAPNYFGGEKRTKPLGKFTNFLLQITEKRRLGNFDRLCKFLREQTKHFPIFPFVFREDFSDFTAFRWIFR